MEKETSCIYCSDYFNFVASFEPSNEEYAYTRYWFEINDDILEVCLDGKVAKFKIHYCPMCGKNLKD